MKPSLSPSNLVNDQLMTLIRASWDYEPSHRPSFEKIAHEVKKQREERSAQSTNSQICDAPIPVPLVAGWDILNPHLPRNSTLPIRLEEREKSLVSRIRSLPGFEDSLKPPPKAATSAEPLSFLMDHLPAPTTPDREIFDDTIKQVERSVH
jgi:nitrogen fixation protein